MLLELEGVGLYVLLFASGDGLEFAGFCLGDGSNLITIPRHILICRCTFTVPIWYFSACLGIASRLDLFH